MMHCAILQDVNNTEKAWHILATNYYKKNSTVVITENIHCKLKYYKKIFLGKKITEVKKMFQRNMEWQKYCSLYTVLTEILYSATFTLLCVYSMSKIFSIQFTQTQIKNSNQCAFSSIKDFMQHKSLYIFYIWEHTHNKPVYYLS